MYVFRAQPFAVFAALAATLSLAACGQGGPEKVADLDNQILGNDADPALTSALEDQIMVDPSLTQQSNRNAVRPATAPQQAQYPAGQDDGASAAGRAAPSGAARSGGGASEVQASLGGDGAGGCGTDFDTNMNWARRLPQAFPVYPGGRVTEAAGNVRTNCRVVTFTTGAAAPQVLGWYRQRAVGAGYSAEQQLRQGDHILAGTNGGSAYYLIVTPRQGGSDVALIANHGA